MTSDNSPPATKALRAWWNNFTSPPRNKREGDVNKENDEHPVFGKPLRESLKYASVQISTANANGELYVWGYIPVVVAKCGLYLKENATEVEGTFRVNGSTKRMRELQAEFETPPRYGKSLDWKKERYTTHDVASVFRRYLTQMPEPVIPHDMYHEFRDALAKKPLNHDEVIATYKQLIQRMSRANQYLLLYVLDLLSVFARKSDKNLMTATNLAVIFRPGLISHPNHEMSPKEHQLSQEVLEFLIEQQDWFLLDIPPPPPSDPISWRSSPSHGRNDPDIADVMLAPSSDEEHSAGSGGWKLVGTEKRRITRRRTTLERTDPEKKDNLSPVAESPRPESLAGFGGAMGVTRSRTLPSGSRRDARMTEAGSGSVDDEKQRTSKVLKKQKRTSHQPKEKETPAQSAAVLMGKSVE